MSTDTGVGTTAGQVIDLDIEGMTCASCVGRVERKLGKIQGVQASVNLPLETATVAMPEGVSVSQIIDTVNAIGYKATLRSTGQLTAPGATGTSPAPAAGHIDVTDDAGESGDRTGSDAKGRTASALGGFAESRETVDAATSRDKAKASAAERKSASLKRRLIIAAVFTIPVTIISMLPAAQFPHWGWAALILSLPVVTWAAWPFHRAAAINARHLSSTMDTLVSIGIAAAFLYSTWQLIADPMLTAHTGMGMGAHSLYFEVAAVVTTFLLLGRFLEANAKQRAGNALKALLNLGAKEATLLRDGAEVKVPTVSLIPGDVFVVRPGEKVATDGFVVEGRSAIDTSLITGESVPTEIGPDDTVIGATMNTSGRLLVKATRVGSETTLAQMGRLVSAAQSGKAPIARLADRISAVFVPIVLLIAVLTFVLWMVLTGDTASAFTAAVAVLVIACPCALGLATPVGLLTGTGRGAQLGILIKGPQVLEDTRTVDTIVLDKTGTVTTGNLSVTAITTLGSLSEDEVLAVAGAVEAASEHPIAEAIAAAAARQGQLDSVANFTSAAGGGVTGAVTGRTVVAGTATWLAENNITITADHRASLTSLQQKGATVIWVAVNGTPEGLISLFDTVKAGSVSAITRFKELGLTPMLLTGDNRAVAEKVAAEVGIAAEHVMAEVLPHQKVEAVKKLQDAGATVAMAGDGVNDAAALAQADLGIAMGSGTDVAIEAADLTVMGSSLEQVAQAIELSRKTLSTIKTNLFWAFFYNAVGIPIAALGLLNPMLAGAAMAASSVLVVANSLRLRAFGATHHTTSNTTHDTATDAGPSTAPGTRESTGSVE
ncbi:copper-translocating P-type ATPase [Arthrobacter echini]|uniref:Copper-translocating P-type ATPase n=2 Tax=Arthrobacter echini TaxID=1529066 RepID=A0A5D0XLL5_9MICC|nr:heavy metal translocating P-type ATPase [Arthrobacter echini]THJ64815.1 copper-translocating P-type ATPase [Arthrobacter echini]TYC97129.1 copper-translocating P-type ATPase [Arthrobacter echini]